MIEATNFGCTVFARSTWKVTIQRCRAAHCKVCACTALIHSSNWVRLVVLCRHYGKFRVYNLCEEHEGNYHPALLYQQMRRVAFDDHNPPTMRQILLFCQNSLDFMRLDSRNMIAVHCKVCRSCLTSRVAQTDGLGQDKTSFSFFFTRRTEAACSLSYAR